MNLKPLAPIAEGIMDNGNDAIPSNWGTMSYLDAFIAGTVMFRIRWRGKYGTRSELWDEAYPLWKRHVNT